MQQSSGWGLMRLVVHQHTLLGADITEVKITER
jgi:hypothetical protein